MKRKKNLIPNNASIQRRKYNIMLTDPVYITPMFSKQFYEKQIIHAFFYVFHQFFSHFTLLKTVCLHWRKHFLYHSLDKHHNLQNSIMSATYPHCAYIYLNNVKCGCCEVTVILVNFTINSFT